VDHPSGLQGNSVVEILCSNEDADILLDHAITYYPPGIPYIIEGIVDGSPAEREYRRKAFGETWHIHSGCSHWPTEDFVASKEPPAAELCNECIVKSKSVLKLGT
jgi:hypothetical protein